MVIVEISVSTQNNWWDDDDDDWCFRAQQQLVGQLVGKEASAKDIQIRKST